MKNCKNCGELLSKNATFCHKCNALQPKKNNTFIIILIVICGLIVLGILGTMLGDIEDIENYDNPKSNYSSTSNKNKENRNEVKVIDFTAMDRDLVNSECNIMKINCTIIEEYSDTSKKGEVFKQDTKPQTTIYEGDYVRIYISLGKEPTMGQKNALKKAELYSDSMYMSKKAIYNQLVSKYGEGFSKEEAQYAIDNIVADWNRNALEKAKVYQESMSMSKNNIYQQLISAYGENFTKEEAQYAIDHLED